MITITTDLNVASMGQMPVVNLSQYDSDFTLVFNLYSSSGTFTMPSGTTAKIRGTKTDGKGFSASASVNVNSKTVTVNGDQQMTAVAGRNVFEITLINSNKELNTVNFLLNVEKAALDRDTIVSESKIMELLDVTDRADAIIAAAEQVEEAAEKLETDKTLTLPDKAADAKVVGDEISVIKEDLDDLAEEVVKWQTGLSDEAKEALLSCFQHVAWLDETSKTYYDKTYYDALEEALYGGSSGYPRLEAVYTPGSHVVYTDDELSILRPYLTVKQIESKGDSGTVITDYTLSGTMRLGDSTITVRKGNMHTRVSINARYAMRQTNNDFVIQHNTCGYKEGIGANLYLDTVASKETTRRRVVVNSGTVPFVYWQSGGTPTESEYYPIPIPTGANSVKVTTSTSALRMGFQILKLENGVYQQYSIRDVDFVNTPIERYFDRSSDLYMMLYMAKSDNSSFDSASEPTDVIIEFGSVDFFGITEWSYPGNLQRYTAGVGAFDSTSALRPALYSTTSQTSRNAMVVNYNPTEMDSIHIRNNGADEGASGYYVIPIPTGCDTVTFACDPTSYYASFRIWHYNGNDSWTRKSETGWKTGRFTWDFSSQLTEGDDGYYATVNIKFNSSGSAGDNVSGFSMTFERSGS